MYVERGIFIISSLNSKERRMQQQRQALMKEKETAEKVAARAFAQSYLADLMPSVFTNLNNGGFFYDPVERGTYMESGGEEEREGEREMEKEKEASYGEEEEK